MKSRQRWNANTNQEKNHGVGSPFQQQFGLDKLQYSFQLFVSFGRSLVELIILQKS